MAQGGERAAQGDDQVVVAVIEVGGIKGQQIAEPPLHAGVDAARALRLERGVIGEGQLEAVGRTNPHAKGGVQAYAAAGDIRRRQLRIHARNAARREERARVPVAGNRIRAEELGAHAAAEKQAARHLIAVLGVDGDFVALQRKGGETGVGDVAIGHGFVRSGDAERGGIVARQADDGAGFALAAQILAEAEAVRAHKAAVVEEEAAEQLLAQAGREVGFIVRAVLGEVILTAAHGVDAGEDVLGIGTPGAWLAHFAGIEVTVHGKALAAETPREIPQHVFVAVIVVDHQAVIIVVRGGNQQAEAGDGPCSGDGEAALVVAAAFGQDIELRRGARLAGDEIDDAGVGIGAVDGGLRAAHDIDMVHRLAGDLGEIETQAAAESNHRDAVDFHQIQVGIAAAQEEAGDAARGAGLIERHAGKVTQQVHGEGLVAAAHAARRNHVGTGRLQGGGDFDGGAHHLHGIGSRGDFELHAGRLIERQGARAEAGRGDDEARIRRFGNVQLEIAVGCGGGLRHHAHAVDGRNLRAGNRGPGWVCDLASDFGSREAGGTNQETGEQAWDVS